jgi:hypothetical protein
LVVAANVEPAGGVDLSWNLAERLTDRWIDEFARVREEDCTGVDTLAKVERN